MFILFLQLEKSLVGVAEKTETLHSSFSDHSTTVMAVGIPAALVVLAVVVYACLSAAGVPVPAWLRALFAACLGRRLERAVAGETGGTRRKLLFVTICIYSHHTCLRVRARSPRRCWSTRSEP